MFAIKEMRELMGEHEALMVYMKTLTRTAESLAAPVSGARERLWNYRYCLHDFQDAISFHMDIDDRVFKSILGVNYIIEDPTEEHREIQRLLNEMVAMADNAVIDKLCQEEMGEFCDRLGLAFKKAVKLIELHIARENGILERVQKALN
jgi:hypothetical protein